MTKPAVIYDAWGKPVGMQAPGRRVWPMPGDIPAELACKGCNGEGRVAVVVRLNADGDEVLERKVMGGYATYFNAMKDRAAADGSNTFVSPVFEQEEHRACRGTGLAVLPPGGGA